MIDHISFTKIGLVHHFGIAIIICAMPEKEIYLSGFLESILNFQGSNGYPTTKNKNVEILIVTQLVLLGHNIQQAKVVLVRLLLDEASSLEPFLISYYPSYVECLDLYHIPDPQQFFFIEYKTCLLVLVARVFALACTNEYLLRTMDSLVAVQ